MDIYYVELCSFILYTDFILKLIKSIYLDSILQSAYGMSILTVITRLDKGFVNFFSINMPIDLLSLT